MEDEKSIKLSAKQQRFVEEYLVDFNATAAAKRAGYSEKTAYSIGSENLRKPEIKKVIADRAAELSMSSEEAIMRISDFARTSLNEYFTIRQLPYTPKVEKPLSDLIKELRSEVEFEEKYARAAGLADKELVSHAARQQDLKRQIIRYEIELEQNPHAARIVDGPTRLIDVPELDMAKLVADKEKGKIKAITPTQFGTKVEMYAADAALVNIAKILGLFAPEKLDTNVKASVHVPITKEDIELFRDVFNSKYGTSPEDVANYKPSNTR